ncbi:MAG TPA: hypothetical protein VIV11_14985 [Kofleriaceae bacterium]
MTIRTLTLVLLLAACGRDDSRKVIERDVAARPDLSHATQADLAGELDQAERRGTWREVRKRWEGQRLRWTVTRHPSLCRSSSACNVAAFPVQQPAQHGWLPALSFAPGQFEQLEAACGDAACEVEIEGTLRRLELSGELPTSLHFGDVRVRAARKT